MHKCANSQLQATFNSYFKFITDFFHAIQDKQNLTIWFTKSMSTIQTQC